MPAVKEYRKRIADDILKRKLEECDNYVHKWEKDTILITYGRQINSRNDC